MPSKYQPLADSLAAQPGDELILTFAQIEAVLSTRLPLSAWTPDWCSNRVDRKRGTRAQTQAWRAAGWRRQSVDLRAGTVTFTRLDRPASTRAE